MNEAVLKDEDAYFKAIARSMEIFDAQTGTPEAAELALLLLLIKDYEDKHILLKDLTD